MAEAEIVIYGAKSIALGVGMAVRELYPECTLRCFLVSSLDRNSSVLMGLPVREIQEFAAHTEKNHLERFHVLIATPEDMHPDIVSTLRQHGFSNYTCMDSRKEAVLMERYFAKIGRFASVHSLQPADQGIRLQVFLAKSSKDRQLKNTYQKNTYQMPHWAQLIQVGAEKTSGYSREAAVYTDHLGTHISEKNGNYCELTALYWIWKNLLGRQHNELLDQSTSPAYFGLFHYRRILDLSDLDLKRMRAGNVDVVLQFPTLHEPDISEHHARYIKEGDWQAVQQALAQLQPDYAAAFSRIMSQPYFYNYNLIVAKRQVLADYCAWLFPILERTEQLSTPKGWERQDRYIGYLGENLMTLYFLYHRKDLRIYHTGRLMLT